MLSKLSVIAQMAFYILLTALTFNGCIHSCNKHKDDPTWLQLTPLAAYRGAEYFWHDDFAGVDWEERIKDDVNTAATLISSSTQVYEIDNVKKQTENFSKKLDTYPIDKYQLVKHGVSIFLEFYKLAGTDMKNYVDTLTPFSDNFKFGQNTQILFDSLDKFYNIGGVEAMKVLSDSIMKSIQNNYDNIDVYRSRFRDHELTDNSIYLRTYQRIFKK